RGSGPRARHPRQRRQADRVPGRAQAAAHPRAARGNGGRGMTQKTDEEIERRTIELVTSHLAVPERGEDYGRGVWARLSPKLGKAPARAFAWRALKPFALAASLLALVAGAFFVGRASNRPSVSGGAAADAPLSADAGRRILLVAVGDHLERS